MKLEVPFRDGRQFWAIRSVLQQSEQLEAKAVIG